MNNCPSSNLLQMAIEDIEAILGITAENKVKLEEQRKADAATKQLTGNG